MTEDKTMEEQGAMVVDFLDGLVASYGMNGTAAVTQIDDDVIDVEINGEGLGVLIGPGGHTLAALGEVSKTALQRRLGGTAKCRVRVDVAGYRATRRAALVEFCADVATKVRDSGQPHAMEPMSSVDRKIVHDALGELDGVGSTSDGEEPRRRVVVVPG